MGVSPDAAENTTERLPLARVLPAIGGVYTAQSVVGGLTFLGVPAVLRANGVALDTIGLVSLAMLPWALKFLWAPQVERYRLPHGRPRRSRDIVVVGQLLAAGALLLLATTGPVAHWTLFAALALVALTSATIDIACDGFAVEQLAPADRGWGNTAQVGGGYLGMVLGSGLFLILVPLVGWGAAVVLLAGALMLLVVPFALVRETTATASGSIPHRPSLRFALARKEVRLGLLITALFEAGIRLAQGMVNPFLVDAGADLATLGLLTGVGAAAAGIVGTACGGLVVRLAGASRAVVIALVLQTAIVALLCVAAMSATKAISLLLALAILKTIVMAVGFVALYSLLMGLSSLRQAGVDFTLFQCADAAVAAVGGASAGVLAQHLGYAPCFAVAALLGTIALMVIPILLLRVAATTSDGNS
ncbi:MAG TPA: MFS transporter [Xanthobacteraceae bacterium]|nr:MFS transporter [Xanthobacteraceae bacterium]